MIVSPTRNEPVSPDRFIGFTTYEKKLKIDRNGARQEIG